MWCATGSPRAAPPARHATGRWVSRRRDTQKPPSTGDTSYDAFKEEPSAEVKAAPQQAKVEHYESQIRAIQGLGGQELAEMKSEVLKESERHQQEIVQYYYVKRVLKL